jgi:tripartite-type tricarboxylate transporter receptor subunit TctC
MGALGCRVLGVLMVLAGLVFPAAAQDYPSRPVRLITQGGAGSGPDVVARIVFDQLGKQWGQQITIINAPGAGGATAARQAFASPGDGYTLYMPAASSFIVMPEMFKDLPFDITRDFVRVGFVAEQPFTIAVAPSLGVSTLPELVALSKQRPGTINYAANARGTLPNLTAERIKAETGADLTFIPYPSAPAGLQDLMGGRIAMIVEGLGTLMGPVRSGTIKPIAITSLTRLPEFADLPTVAELVPGFIATGWFALLAPPGTPDAIVAKVNADLKAAVENPEVKKRLFDLATFPRPMSPEETTAFVRSERDAWKATVQKVGFSQ